MFPPRWLYETRFFTCCSKSTFVNTDSLVFMTTSVGRAKWGGPIMRINCRPVDDTIKPLLSSTSCTLSSSF